MKIPTVEEMLKAGLHFGHRQSKWHPKMKPYIFGARNGVHIIDLEKTGEKLAEALEAIKKMCAENKTILLVGTKAQVKLPLKKLAEEIGAPYVAEKWLGGLLTNFAVIKKMIKTYNDLQEKKRTGRLDKYTKKERLDIDREITRLELKVGGLANLIKNPDVIFIWDIKHERTAKLEALKKNIPIIAVCDTNANPEGIKHIIPANDDATKGIKLIFELIKEAALEGKKKTINN